VILVEVKELSLRTAHPLDHTANAEATLEELDFIDESRNFVVLTEVAIKQAMATRYNRKVRPRGFDSGDLVLRRRTWVTRTPGKKSWRQIGKDYTESAPTQGLVPTSSNHCTTSQSPKHGMQTNLNNIIAKYRQSYPNLTTCLSSAEINHCKSIL